MIFHYIKKTLPAKLLRLLWQRTWSFTFLHRFSGIPSPPCPTRYATDSERMHHTCLLIKRKIHWPGILKDNNYSKYKSLLGTNMKLLKKNNVSWLFFSNGIWGIILCLNFKRNVPWTLTLITGLFYSQCFGRQLSDIYNLRRFGPKLHLLLYVGNQKLSISTYNFFMTLFRCTRKFPFNVSVQEVNRRLHRNLLIARNCTN